MRNYALLFSFLFLFVVTDLDAQRRSGRASKRVDESKNVENVKPDELHKKYGFSSRDQMVEFLLEKDLKRSDKRIVEKYGKGKKLSKSQARKFESLLKQHAGERAVSESGRSGRVSGDRALSGSGRGSSASRAPSRGRSGRQAADDMGMEHDSTMTPVMHLLGGLDGFLNDKVADNKLDSDQVQPMMELANNLETATHSEWESEDNAGAAGAAMEAAEQYLNDNNIDPGVRGHYLRELCYLEYEAHAENGPMENPPDCGDGDGHDGPPPFEEVDANGNGSISRDEARAFFGDEPDFDAQFDEVDTDNSGSVDPQEYADADDGDRDGGHDWYCQICDMHFDSGEAMDNHAAQMGHTDTDFDCDPNHDYPQMDPGPDGGCADYADCNGNGVAIGVDSSLGCDCECTRGYYGDACEFASNIDDCICGNFSITGHLGRKRMCSINDHIDRRLLHVTHEAKHSPETTNSYLPG